LPRYRGFAPVVNALINGDRWLGVTALLGGAEYDTGLILGQKKIELIYPVTVRDAILATAPLYQHLMFEILDKYRSMGILRGQAQDERLATYSLWRDESDYRIDWRQSSQKIKRPVQLGGQRSCEY
jgi:methionyl-tRNA formyltransferase